MCFTLVDIRSPGEEGERNYVTIEWQIVCIKVGISQGKTLFLLFFFSFIIFFLFYHVNATIKVTMSVRLTVHQVIHPYVNLLCN